MKKLLLLFVLALVGCGRLAGSADQRRPGSSDPGADAQDREVSG